MSPTHEPIDWPDLSELLEDAGVRAAVDALFPQTQRISFRATLDIVDADTNDAETTAETTAEIWRIGRTLEVASQLSDCPIIAIAGMLNSGKTSLVATFLSETGRTRSLRGDANSEGTHRFVLWLPQSWRSDAELWGLLIERLGAALGHSPELLSDDPLQAHRQYNNADHDREAIGVPLVATDPLLDERGVGLLDCPDIVTSEAFGMGALAVRREMLKRAATLCSAFIITTDFGSIRANTVGELLDAASESMPGVRRFLAINKIRPKYRPAEVLEDIRPLITDHAITDSYLAYDFEIDGSSDYLPVCAATLDGLESLPVFFRACPDEDTSQLGLDALLFSLPQQLDRSEIFASFRDSQQHLLARKVWTSGVDRIRDHIESRRQRILWTRQAICDCSMEFFARRDSTTSEVTELRLHQSREIITQLAQAFADAAPWYARLGMRMNGWFTKISRSASELVGRMNISGAAHDKAIEIRDRFRRGSQGAVLTSDKLRDALRRHDVAGQMRINFSDTDLDMRCETVVHRFDQEDQTSLDPQQLKITAAELWQELSILKKLQHGLTPVAALFASFAAVLMVPFDGGGTLLLHASIAELLVATGFTGLVTAWNSRGSLKAMELQAALQQLSDFISIQCDVFGVPYMLDGIDPITVSVAGRIVCLPPPKVASRPVADTPLRMWMLRPPFIDELHRMLPRE